MDVDSNNLTNMRNQTVKDLLNSYPLHGATVVAGENGLNRKISLFGVLEAPDSTNFVKPNEFLITTGYSLKESKLVELNTIQRLIEKNAAGLGIKLNRYIREFSQETLQYANEHAFPIISLPAALSWYEVINSILAMNFTSTGQYADIIDRFRHNLFLSNTYEEILDHMSRLMMYPCTFFSKKDKKIIDSAGNSHSVLMLHSITDNLKKDDPENSMSLMNISRVRYNLNNETVLVCPIRSKSDNTYYFLLWEGKEPLSYDQMLTFQFASMLIWWKLIEFEKANDAFTNEKNEFLLNLITSNPVLDENLFVKARSLLIKIKSHFILSLECFAKVNNELRESAFTNDVIRTIDQICGRNEYSYCCISDEKICLFIPISVNFETDQKMTEYILPIAQNIQNEMQNIHTGYQFGIGIGSLAKSLAEFNHSYKTSRISLMMANQVLGKGQIGNYNQSNIYKLLYEDEKGANFGKYIEQYIAPLLKVDAQTNGALLKTLQLFFKLGRSNRKCSKEMFVHQNTIIYRLKKIEKICGLDLNDPNDIMVMEIALKMYEISKAIS
ncbi:MAG: PucR family transcriptional regulator [Christensenellales bacterium]